MEPWAISKKFMLTGFFTVNTFVKAGYFNAWDSVWFKCYVSLKNTHLQPHNIEETYFTIHMPNHL